MGLSTAEKVAAGMGKLDELAPGWEEKIDAPIDVAWGIYCPLGQTFGTYGKGLKAMGMPGALHVRDMGFLHDHYDASDLSALNAEWERRIALRRQEQEQVVDGLITDLDERLSERVLQPA